VSDTAIRVGNGWVEADRIVSLPQVVGPRLAGVPCDDQGFIPVDEFGRVAGASGLYAAGDATNRPIKHGGLAAQQASAAASHIARLAGGGLDARPYRPILRGLLRTAEGPLYLRTGLDNDDPTPPTASPEPLWWPPSKLVAPRLTSFLARLEAEQRGPRGLVDGGLGRAAAAG
jgi:sulfide:quinone oxidoreductase